MRSLEDWELIALAKQGNLDAFNTLVERHQRNIFNLCYYLTRDRHIAEDLVQETFIRIYRSLPTIRPKAQFKTFIYGIARNLAFNHVRNETRKNGFLHRFFNWLNAYKSMTKTNNTPEKQFEQTSREEKIYDCINSLPYEYKEVLLLREMHGLDYESIAKVLGCKIGTVRSRLFRARAYLRKKALEEGIIEK